MRIDIDLFRCPWVFGKMSFLVLKHNSHFPWVLNSQWLNPISTISHQTLGCIHLSRLAFIIELIFKIFYVSIWHIYIFENSNKNSGTTKWYNFVSWKYIQRSRFMLFWPLRRVSESQQRRLEDGRHVSVFLREALNHFKNIRFFFKLCSPWRVSCILLPLSLMEYYSTATYEN